MLKQAGIAVKGQNLPGRGAEEEDRRPPAHPEARPAASRAPRERRRAACSPNGRPAALRSVSSYPPRREPGLVAGRRQTPVRVELVLLRGAPGAYDGRRCE